MGKTKFKSNIYWQNLLTSPGPVSIFCREQADGTVYSNAKFEAQSKMLFYKSHLAVR